MRNIFLILSLFIFACDEEKESEDIVHSVQKYKLPIYIFEGDIIQFKNWLKAQRLLIAPDSMAGHLAAYLGIPVISLFGAQNPELTKPLGDKNIIAKPSNECTHQRDHWRLCSACMKTIEPVSVRESVINLVMRNYEK